VLGAHAAARLVDQHVFAQTGDEGGADAGGGGGVIDGRRGVLQRRAGHGRQLVLGHAEGQGRVAADAVDAVQQLRPHLGAVGADRQLHVHPVGDDVVLDAAVDGADGDHGPLKRIGLAAAQGLQRHHDLRRHQNGIHAQMRRGAVGADAVDGDVHAVRTGRGDAQGRLDLAGRRVGRDVEGQGVVRLGEAGIEAVVDHGPGAEDALLGWLGDQNQGAGPVALARRHLTRRADQGGDVHIVAAGVHDRLLGAVAVDLTGGRGVGQARVFQQRQAVHVGADHDGGAGAVLQHRDHAGPADAGGDLIAQAAQFLRHAGGVVGLHRADIQFAGADGGDGLGRGQGAGGGREVGRLHHQRRAADFEAVGQRLLALGGVEDQLDLAVLHRVDDVRTAFEHLVDQADLDAFRLQIVVGAAGGDDREALGQQRLHRLQDEGLVGVLDRDEGAAFGRQDGAAADLRLGEGAGEGGGHVGLAFTFPVQAHDLAGRAHFRSKQCVNAREAGEWEHGFLDCDVLQFLVDQTEGLQRNPGHDLGGDGGDRLAGGLGHERHGARGTRVHFQQVDARVVAVRLLDGELHVHQAAHLQGLGHGGGLALQLGRRRPLPWRGSDSGRSGRDRCPRHAWPHGHSGPVAHGRGRSSCRGRPAHRRGAGRPDSRLPRPSGRLLRPSGPDRSGAVADRWPAASAGSARGLRPGRWNQGWYRSPARRWLPAPAPASAGSGHRTAPRRRSDRPWAVPVRRFPARLPGSAARSTGVDHDRLDADVGEGERRVAAAVVELDALADAVGTAAEDDGFLLVRRGGFALGDLAQGAGLIGRIHIGGGRGELGGAGVDALEHRAHAERATGGAHGGFGRTGQLGQTGVGEALGLELAEVDLGRGQALDADVTLGPDQVGDLAQEPGLIRAGGVDLFDRQAVAEGLGDDADAVRGRLAERTDDGGAGARIVVGVVGAFDLDLVQPGQAGAADGHDLADRLHGGGQGRLRTRILLEGEARDLGDDIVDRRLEAGRRHHGDVVGQFVQGVADGQLGGDLGDGEAGGLGRQRRGARHARVHFNHDHAAVGRVDRELHVGAAGLDADLA
uniref:NAD-specific glutamate dehydrogenase n=1 Tax=Parastrongyloides trichosuri TaxID=131310 RepID=A0A0N4ZAF6_PARTI